MSRFRRPLAMAALALVAAGLLDLTADRTHRLVDLTAERSLSLTDQTKSIVARVRTPTTITAFLPPEDPERAPAGALLLRYQRLNRRIRFRLLDPLRSQGEQRRLGIDPAVGGIAVVQGKKVEIVSTVTEQDVTGALARLARGRTAELCFTTGHGEAAIVDTGPQGLSTAAGLLTRNGYHVRSVDLLASSVIPDECDGVVVANPTADVGAAGDVLAQYLNADGRLLVLADPVSRVDLNPIVSRHQLGIRRGVVLEGDPDSALPDDPTSPIVRTYTSGNPIVRRLAPTFFPGVEQIVTGESRAADGLVVNALAQTSRLSYLETEPLTSVFDPASDTPGPIAVAGAAARTRLEGDAVKGSRVVVVGDVDFASNALLTQAANSTFLVQALDWLTLDDQLVVLSANLPDARVIELTSGRIAYARFVSIGLLPGVFLLVGAAVWTVRRAR